MNLSYRNSKNAEAIANFWGKSLDKPDWYKIEAKSDEEIEIFIYDVIGYPYTDVSGLIQYLGSVKDKKILIRINSPGGDVFDGMALYNAIAAHPGGVITRIESLAASIGSVIAVAGKEVQAYKNTMMMIHNSWVLAMGNQYGLQEIIEIMQKVDENLIEAYTGKSKMGKREVAQMMKDTTWLNAKEMKEKGLIDTIIDGKAVRAQFDISVFSCVPEELSEEINIRGLEQALRDAGLSKSKAKAVLARGWSALENEAEEEEVSAQIKKVIKIITKGGSN